MPVKESTDLYQTGDRDFSEEDSTEEDQLPMGLPPGIGPSVHNVNTVVQPSITVQSSIRRLTATKQVESMPIRKGVNLSKKHFNQDLKFLERDLTKFNVSPLGKKDGLALFWLHDRRLPTFYFRNEQKEIVGYLTVSTAENNTVSGVFLDDRYRGHGLGTVLYLAAIRVLKRLRSSTDIGIMAVRTWKSISKYYPVKLCNDADDSRVPYTWDDRGIPVTNDRPIDKQPGYFYFLVGK